jgi:RNA polymerase sigma-70 factor, ECF subfamily
VNTEKELLEKAHAFDLDGLAEVYDGYSPGVYRYAMRLLGDQGLAEDCVSETFNRFLLALRNGGGPEDHLQAYLYRIAHNWITDYYRRQPLPPLDMDDELWGEGDNPDQLVADEMERVQVRAALVHLTPEQRQVVLLKYVEGWGNEAIARALDRPVTAIKALQHRALGALRRMLLPQEEKV